MSNTLWPHGHPTVTWGVDEMSVDCDCGWSKAIGTTFTLHDLWALWYEHWNGRA